MITNAGKTVIKNYFGGQVRQIGNVLAFGSGTTAPAVTDTALVTEVARANVTSISADLANNRIVFKATIAPGEYTINEVGLYAGSLPTDPLVARVVLDTPKETDPNLPTEIEYSLGINV